MIYTAFFASLLLAGAAVISAEMCPTPSGTRHRVRDAPFTAPPADLHEALHCVGGLQNVIKPILLGEGSSFGSTNERHNS